MTTPEEHKELSEVEATANQGQPISDRQQSKELQKEEVSSTVLPSLLPTETFSHYKLAATWSHKPDQRCPLSLKEKTGVRRHL